MFYVSFAEMVLIAAKLVDDPRFTWTKLSGSAQVDFTRISDGLCVFKALPGTCGYVTAAGMSVEPIKSMMAQDGGPVGAK